MASIYCSNCGKMIRETSNFCQFCGAAQHGDEAAVYRAQEPTIVNTVGAQAVANAHKPHSAHKKAKPGIINKKNLCGRAKWSFVIGYLKYTGIIFLLLLGGLIIEPLMSAGALIFYIFTLYIFASLVHGYFYYGIDEYSFNMEYGIIHKKHISIPFDKIHNVNITRTFTDRILGLARIEIETSGNSLFHKNDVIGGNITTAEGMLPGLTLKQAEKVHDILLERRSGAE
ncbi:MAG TPA: PH domain-containing protein [Candidatus Saccharimonadales bacterium]|nr:PH domain-containing protein [Candidatus Saccharimonadales bacterium]